MKPRSQFQTMGYWIKEPTILDPERARAQINRLAAEGYDAIRVFPRCIPMSHLDPRLVGAMDKIVKMAHAVGLKVALDCEPHGHQIGRDMGARFPDGMGERLVPVRCQLRDGHFILRSKWPRTGQQVPMLLGVEAAFILNGGNAELLETFEYTHNQEQEWHDSGFTERSNSHDPHRQLVATMGDNLSGRLLNHRDGELLVFLLYQDTQLIDFWSEATAEYYNQLLDAYSNIPLDGLGWDEPFADMEWSHYRYGRAFAAAFKKLHGYELRPQLYQLENGAFTPDALKIRMDYYYALNEGSFYAQKNVVAKSKQLWGKDILLGSHHTWGGEGHINDYRAGAVDYFRLGENMDAGYADCPWYFERSMYYVYVLGGSLGRLSPSNCTEMNVWTSKPTVSQTDYNTRLLAMMRLNWFNIWFGDASDTTLYPDHYTYPACVEFMHRNQRVQALLADAVPVVETAVWHGWEGIMAINRADYAFAQKDFFLYSCTELFLRNQPYDFIDSRLLAAGTVRDGKLHTRLGSYRLIILPFATVLPESAWNKLVELAENGGQVLFTGMPPRQTCEGRNLEVEFAQCAGMKTLPLELFHAHIQHTCQLPVHDSFPLEVRVPVETAGGTPWINIEGETCGASGMNGHFHYWSEFVPRAELANWVEKMVPPPVTVESDSILARLYSQPDGSQLLALVARRDRDMKGIVLCGNVTLRISGGRLAIYHLTASGAATVLFQDGEKSDQTNQRD